MVLKPALISARSAAYDAISSLSAWLKCFLGGPEVITRSRRPRRHTTCLADSSRYQLRCRWVRADNGEVRPSVLTGAHLAARQDPRVRRRLAVGFAVLWAAVALHAVLALSGLATTNAEMVRVTDIVYIAVGATATTLAGLRARNVQAERAAWWWMAASMALFTLGNVLWDVLYLDLAQPPYPSWADAAHVLYYVPTYVGIALLIRTRLRGLPRAVALDGLVSALGLAALSAGLVLGPILAETQGDPFTVLVNLAYPIGDLMLLALCVATLALTRGRLDPAWLILIAGVSANAVADTTYLFQAAVGPYAGGTPLHMLWVLAMASVGLAAWQIPRRATEHVPGRAEHAVPALFAMATVALLAYGALTGSTPEAAVGLAVATLLVAAVRVALVIRDVQQLSESRRLAESDELTGLLNRRGLALRLEAALREGRSGPGGLSLLLLASTGSRRSTTRSATTPATSCCARSPDGW